MQVPQKKVADYAGLAGWLLIAVAFFPSWQLAYGGDDKRELQCSENNAKLTQYISDDQKVHALWGKSTRMTTNGLLDRIKRSRSLFETNNCLVGQISASGQSDWTGAPYAGEIQVVIKYECQGESANRRPAAAWTAHCVKTSIEEITVQAWRAQRPPFGRP